MATLLKLVNQALPAGTTARQPEALLAALESVNKPTSSYLRSLQLLRARIAKEVLRDQTEGAALEANAYVAYADWHNSEETKNPNIRVLRRDGKLVRMGNFWAEFVRTQQAAEAMADKLRRNQRYLRSLDERIEIVRRMIAFGIVE